MPGASLRLRTERAGRGSASGGRLGAPGWRTGALPGPAQREAGFSLVEVLVAVVVLLVVLVPVGSLLAGSDQVASTGQFRATAAQLAASDVAAVQLEAAEHPGVLPPFSQVPGLAVPVATPEGQPPTWNTEQPPLVATLGAEQYRQWVDGGWCDQAPTSTAGTSGQLAAVGQGPPVFLVAVKVVWGPTGARLGVDAPASASVVSFQVLTPEPAWPATGDEPTSDCPEGLG